MGPSDNDTIASLAYIGVRFPLRGDDMSGSIPPRIKIRGILETAMKERRRKIVRERKNFLPSLMIMGLLWTTLGAIVYFTDPDVSWFVLLFFGILFFALLFTFSIVLTGAKKGLIAATTLVLFLVLRYFGVGNLLNGLLISGVAIACLIYFWYSD